MGLFSARCTSTTRIDNRVVIITGCNTGIGKVTAKDLYQRGAIVIMACRDVDKASEAIREIKGQFEGQERTGSLHARELDLSSLQSVRDFIHTMDMDTVDILINNAGVMMCPAGKTEDGYDIQFGVNHLGHFLLTLLLLPKILRSEHGRIINVSSRAHSQGAINFDDLNFEKRRFSSIGAYAQSKLANILFSKELARRLKEAGHENITVYSLHPGVVGTDLWRHLDKTYFRGLSFLWNILSSPFVKTAEQGAQTTIHCSVDEKCAHESGLYYAECAVTEPTRAAQNMEDAKRLWEESWKLVKLPEDYKPFLPRS